MPSLSMLPPIIILIGSIGGAVTAIAFLAGSLINGLMKADKELIRTLTERIGVLEDNDKDKQRQLNKQSAELIQVQDKNAYDENRIKELVAILENRSPALEQTLTELNKKSLEILSHLSAIHACTDEAQSIGIRVEKK